MKLNHCFVQVSHSRVVLNRELFKFFLIAFISIPVLASDFKPLEEFGMIKGPFQKEGMSDKDMEHVAFRCLGLTTAIMNVGIEPKTKKEKQIKEFFKKNKVNAAKIAYYSFNSANKIEAEAYELSNPYYEAAKEVLPPINQKYLSLIIENYKKNGNYFENDFLWGDIDICGSSLQMADKIYEETERKK